MAYSVHVYRFKGYVPLLLDRLVQWVERPILDTHQKLFSTFLDHVFFPQIQCMSYSATASTPVPVFYNQHKDRVVIFPQLLCVVMTTLNM